jgi:hypothetical protein
MSLSDFAYSVLALYKCLAPKDIKIIWLSNIFALSVPDEGYSRNASWALNLISTFLFQRYIYSQMFPYININITTKMQYRVYMIIHFLGKSFCMYIINMEFSISIFRYHLTWFFQIMLNAFTILYLLYSSTYLDIFTHALKCEPLNNVYYHKQLRECLQCEKCPVGMGKITLEVRSYNDFVC